MTGAYKKSGDKPFSRAVAIGQGVVVLNYERVYLDEIREDVLYFEIKSEALEHIAQRSCGYLRVFKVRSNGVLSNLV